MQEHLAIDPGSQESAILAYVVVPNIVEPPWGVLPTRWAVLSNSAIELIINGHAAFTDSAPASLALESIRGMHSSSGVDQLVTERFVGGLHALWRWRVNAGGQETSERPVYLVARQSARAATIGRAAGGDSLVRRALIEMYGGDTAAFGQKCKACKGKGHRRNVPCEDCDGTGWSTPQGPLAGMTGTDVFAALAVAIAVHQPGGPGHVRR